MAWCSMNITYGPTGYSQNYKRNVPAHSHPAEQQFVRDCLTDSLTGINQQLPQGQPPARQDLLGQNHLRVEQPNDPGNNYRAI